MSKQEFINHITNQYKCTKTEAEKVINMFNMSHLINCYLEYFIYDFFPLIVKLKLIDIITLHCYNDRQFAIKSRHKKHN